MSIRMGMAVAAGLFAAFGLVGNAGAEMAAPKKAAPAKMQRFNTCAFKGTPEFCTMIQVGGKLYNVSGSNIQAGKMASGSGTPTTDFSPCGGTVLKVAKANVGRNCPAPKAKKK
jgi:hypothetical protein